MPLKTNDQGIKYDWYQTEADVIINIIKRNMAAENCKAQVSDDGQGLQVHVKDDCAAEYKVLLDIRLLHPVLNNAALLCRPAKMELKLRKKSSGHWGSLESESDKTGGNAAHQYPTSSNHAPVNWDQLEKEAVKEEEEQKLDGDAAVNKLFQQIYRDSSDETKKAMMKSFQESGGTVLSTNWNEVKKDKVECKPPDGMEYKKYA